MQDNYVYVKLLPTSSTTNEKSDTIANRINLLYSNNNERLLTKLTQLNKPNKYKISFLVNIKKQSIVFYAIVPKFYYSEFETLCENAWKGINLEILEELPLEYDKDYTVSTLNTKESNALSLRVDKRDNFLLSSVLSSSNLLDDSEEVTVLYNFIPASRTVLKTERGKIKDDIELYKKNYNVSKNKSAKDMLINVARVSFEYTGEVIEDTLKEFNINRSTNKNKNYTEFKMISDDTKKKEKLELIQTQILVLSKGKDKTRQKNINDFIVDNFSRISGDNNLIGKTKFIKANKKKPNNINFLQHKYNAPINILSADECQHFISLPGSTLMKEYKQIENIPYKQLNIPDCTGKGYITSGVGNDRGKRKKIFLSDEEKEISTTGTFMIGPQGSGKSTFMKHYICDALDNGDLIVVYDYIGNNEFARDLVKIIPKEYCHVIDLSNYKGDNAQAIAYNELDIKHIKRNNYESEEDWKDAVCDAVATYAEQIIFLMQSVNGEGVGADFTPRMKKIIKGAAILTFSQSDKTIMDMYNVLIDHVYRHKILDEMPSFIKKDFDLDIKEFLSVIDLDKLDLDPITKKPKLDENGNPKKIVLGTQESSITFLLDRFYPFRSNRKLRILAEKSPVNNINFADLFINSEKKVIIIKIPDESFQGQAKDVICNFYANKILTAMKIRQSEYVRKNPSDPKAKKMTMAHILFDELYILKSTVWLIKEWITQFRKFRLKPFYTGHSMQQLPVPVADAIKSAGYNYIISGPLDNKSFENMHEFFKEFNAEQCSSLLMKQFMVSLRYLDGRKNFIVTAPGDVVEEGHKILKK